MRLALREVLLAFRRAPLLAVLAVWLCVRTLVVVDDAQCALDRRAVGLAQVAAHATGLVRGAAFRADPEQVARPGRGLAGAWTDVQLIDDPDHGRPEQETDHDRRRRDLAQPALDRLEYVAEGTRHRFPPQGLQR